MNTLDWRLTWFGGTVLAIGCTAAVLGQGRNTMPDTGGSLIFSPDRLVATIGLQDMVIVDTGDVLLICPRSRTQDVKRLVEMLREQGMGEYLS